MEISSFNIPLSQAKILILGFTFKENCPDIRNTKVIDIVKRLNRFNINPVVIDADPPGIFNRSAMRTIVKWKYKPRIVGGKAVPRAGVQHLITYELEDAR